MAAAIHSKAGSELKLKHGLILTSLSVNDSGLLNLDQAPSIPT